MSRGDREIREITGVPTSITAFVGRVPIGASRAPIRCLNYADFERRCGGLWSESELAYAVLHYFQNGGQDALIAAVTGSASVEDYEDAIDRLAEVETFNLLVIPPPSRTADVDPDVLAKAAAICQREHAVLLVDPPSSWSNLDDVVEVEGLDFLRLASTAFYYPQVVCADPLQANRPRGFAPSGMVAGVIARTDARYGVWTAPSGPEASLLGAVGLANDLNEAEVARLHAAGVNALVARSTGPVICGALTGRGIEYVSGSKSVPAQRLLWFVLDSIERGTSWTELEPNDERRWERLRQQIERFLSDLYRRGALRGRTEREAFHVRCDAHTTPEADIRAGFARVEIGYVPAPGEYTRLYYRRRAGQGGS